MKDCFIFGERCNAMLKEIVTGDDELSKALEYVLETAVTHVPDWAKREVEQLCQNSLNKKGRTVHSLEKNVGYVDINSLDYGDVLVELNKTKVAEFSIMFSPVRNLADIPEYSSKQEILQGRLLGENGGISFMANGTTQQINFDVVSCGDAYYLRLQHAVDDGQGLLSTIKSVKVKPVDIKKFVMPGLLDGVVS